MSINKKKIFKFLIFLFNMSLAFNNDSFDDSRVLTEEDTEALGKKIKFINEQFANYKNAYQRIINSPLLKEYPHIEDFINDFYIKNLTFKRLINQNKAPSLEKAKISNEIITLYKKIEDFIKLDILNQKKMMQTLRQNMQRDYNLRRRINNDY